MNPPTVHMAMPKEIAFDRIGVGKSSAAVHWWKMYQFHSFHYPVIPYSIGRVTTKYQPIPIK